MKRIIKRFLTTDGRGRPLIVNSERLFDDQRGRLSLTTQRTAISCSGCRRPLVNFEELRGRCDACGIRGSCLHCETKCDACSRRICGRCRRGFAGPPPRTVCLICLHRLRKRQAFLDEQVLHQAAFQRRMHLQRQWLRVQALRLRATQLRAQERLVLLREMHKLRLVLGQTSSRARWFSR